jgi:hypothetical protein
MCVVALGFTRAPNSVVRKTITSTSARDQAFCRPEEGKFRLLFIHAGDSARHITIEWSSPVMD